MTFQRCTLNDLPDLPGATKTVVVSAHFNKPTEVVFDFPGVARMVFTDVRPGMSILSATVDRIEKPKQHYVRGTICGIQMNLRCDTVAAGKLFIDDKAGRCNEGECLLEVVTE